MNSTNPQINYVEQKKSFSQPFNSHFVFNFVLRTRKKKHIQLLQKAERFVIKLKFHDYTFQIVAEGLKQVRSD